METKIKYRVKIKLKKKCGNCGPDRWMTLETTTDPIGYQKEHPNWVLKFEQAILK